ncbi:MAG TPA: hypothetical protein VE733_22815 [Streptosporangiaceae bacterium]|nr:hypothetical protein [Streptosporangiaceae bacterium]
MYSAVTSVPAVEPQVTGRVPSGVVGIEVDEYPLNQPVADLEYVAPPSGAPFRDAGAPWPVAVLTVAGSLGDDDVAPEDGAWSCFLSAASGDQEAV